MAELATIARPYAEALFQVAGAEPKATAAWLGELAAVAADPQLAQFAAHPKISDEQVFDLIAGVARSALPESARNFLRIVIENDRLTALPEVAAQFRVLQNERDGSRDAVLYSAFALQGQALEDVVAVLETRFGRKLNVTVRQDASLIGGIRVVVGDKVLDASVKARLEQMKVALTA